MDERWVGVRVPLRLCECRRLNPKPLSSSGEGQEQLPEAPESFIT